jgi:energy-coupling factor transporter transmembrane protein EcfT
MNPKVILIMGFLFAGLITAAVAAYIPFDAVTAIPKFLLFILGMGFVIVGFSSRYYSYLIAPILRQRSRHIVLSDQVPYWLATTGDCIVSKRAEDFIATAYINIPLYVSSSEMADEERERFSNQISRLVGVNKEPVRFSSVLRIMDKDDYLKKIKELIGNAENEESLAMQKNDPVALERARGKLSMWKKILDHIGSKSSMELVTFASVSATGGREYEAITIVQQQAKDLMNGIGTILGVTPNIIVGSEILKLVEPEYLIPLSTISEEITKKIEHGEVE